MKDGYIMKCTLNEIRNKEIINVRSGTKLGYADDIEFDAVDFSVKAFVIYGRYRLFGLLGRENDIIIICRDIQIIGTDTILVSADESNLSKKTSVTPKSLCK